MTSQDLERERERERERQRERKRERERERESEREIEVVKHNESTVLIGFSWLHTKFAINTPVDTPTVDQKMLHDWVIQD